MALHTNMTHLRLKWDNPTLCKYEVQVNNEKNQSLLNCLGINRLVYTHTHKYTYISILAINIFRWDSETVFQGKNVANMLMELFFKSTQETSITWQNFVHFLPWLVISSRTNVVTSLGTSQVLDDHQKRQRMNKFFKTIISEISIFASNKFD